MSGIAVQCNMRFGKGLKRSPGALDSMRVPRVTRMLALAYHIDRLIDSGKVKDYAEAARIFGVTRGRMFLSLQQDLDGPRRIGYTAFDPIWEQLTTAERARILQLLIEEVRYNALEGEVEIKFRPGGIRAMAREEAS